MPSCRSGWSDHVVYWLDEHRHHVSLQGLRHRLAPLLYMRLFAASPPANLMHPWTYNEFKDGRFPRGRAAEEMVSQVIPAQSQVLIAVMQLSRQWMSGAIIITWEKLVLKANSKISTEKRAKRSHYQVTNPGFLGENPGNKPTEPRGCADTTGFVTFYNTCLLTDKAFCQKAVSAPRLSGLSVRKPPGSCLTEGLQG